MRNCAGCPFSLFLSFHLLLFKWYFIISFLFLQMITHHLSSEYTQVPLCLGCHSYCTISGFVLCVNSNRDQNILNVAALCTHTTHHTTHSQSNLMKTYSIHNHKTFREISYKLIRSELGSWEHRSNYNNVLACFL